MDYLYSSVNSLLSAHDCHYTLKEGLRNGTALLTENKQENRVGYVFCMHPLLGMLCSSRLGNFCIQTDRHYY